MCVYHMCFSAELQIVCNERFNLHISAIAACLGEPTANQLWTLAEQLKEIHLPKNLIPVVWAITLLNPGMHFKQFCDDWTLSSLATVRDHFYFININNKQGKINSCTSQELFVCFVGQCPSKQFFPYGTEYPLSGY